MTERLKFTEEVEDLFVQFLYSDPEIFVRVKNITSPSYFDDPDNKKIVKFMVDYTGDHTSLPTPEQMKAVTGKAVEKITDLNDEHTDWFMKEYERFCQQKAARQVVYESLDLIEKDALGEVVEKIKKAAEIGIVRDLGINYFEDPGTRLRKMRDRSTVVSTGWKSIDTKLYGGIERGTLTIWAGQSGAGKSLFLQNQALNWAELGLNVIYLSLELSESLCAMRLDAMTAGYSTKEIMKNIDDVDMRVRAYHKKIGKGAISIKQLPNGCTSNDIRAYLKEYEIQMGRKCDAILVDYLDLCSPTNRKVDPGNLFVKDKYVSEELRNIAVEHNLIMVTASQLNRGSHDEIEFDHSHIAGGISKINTADIVIGIFTTISMKEGGRYQVQFMKTRSSSGVGSKVDLKFDVRSLRIRDLEEGEDDATTAAATNILESLQKKNVVSDKDTKGTGAATRLDNENPLKQIQALRSLVKKTNI